jgi:hypothetical protein
MAKQEHVHTKKGNGRNTSRLVLGVGLGIAALAVVTYLAGRTTPAEPVYPGMIYFDEPEVVEPVREVDQFTKALEKGLLQDAGAQGVLRYLKTHSEVPDWVILRYYRKEDGGPY